MIKKITLLVLLFITSYLDGAHLTTPKKMQKASIIDFFSPDKPRITFDKFRTYLIKALEAENTEGFHKIFMKYFNTIVYPMQIKDKKFYASLFYAIFQEIANRPAFHESKKDFEKITTFVQNSQGRFFALEIFIYSQEQGDEESDSEETQETLITPETINRFCDYGFQLSEKAQTIRMFLNVADNRKLIIDALDTSETTRFKIIDPEDCARLDTKAKSPIHSIIHQLDKKNPNFNQIQHHLEIFYNSIPSTLTRPFREKRCEKFYHALFFAMLNLLRFNYASTECYTKEGRIDVLINSTVHGYEINRPIIIEFKHKGSAIKALNQIYARSYLKGISHSDNCKPLVVGINIKSNTPEITVQIAFEEYDDKTSPLRRSKLKHQRSLLSSRFLDFTNCE